MDEPVLSMVKVPCDPAQVIVNHASFRVQLASPPPVRIAVPGVTDTAPLPRVPAAAGRRRPLVWTGRSAPGDPGATTLVQAARAAGRADAPTQLLPRVPVAAGAVATAPTPVVARPRGPRPPETAGEQTRLLPPLDVSGDEPPAPPAGPDGARRRPRAADGRQAFQPGRRASRLSLGLVLLPLRVLLGFIAIYAGMGKLTDPVYFDGGLRGSLYAWLDGLQPWTVAAPLHEWALAHPVGAGLTVAFTQIIVGVLTVFGLWQRVAAGLGALLSLALLVTVSWSNGPAYDTPDIILCAAWSPLLIAGAPVYSLDARLATEAWRTLGPRAAVADLRRRVLRRGAVLAALLVGVALLIGAMLGGAVRSAQFPAVPDPEEPRNHLPGMPLPEEEAKDEPEQRAERQEQDDEGPTAGPTAEESGADEAETGTPEGALTTGPTAGTDAGATPEGTGQEAPGTEQTVPAPEQPAVPEQSYAPPEEPAAPEPVPADPGGEPAGEPSAPGGDGGEQSSLGPIGGLLG
jgi:uncharacterized membrane protein YphA (DoxX/SURF4 family)